MRAVPTDELVFGSGFLAKFDAPPSGHWVLIEDEDVLGKNGQVLAFPTQQQAEQYAHWFETGHGEPPRTSQGEK